MSDSHLRNLKRAVESWLMGWRRKREASLRWRLATLPPTQQGEVETSFPTGPKDRGSTSLKSPSKEIDPRRVLEWALTWVSPRENPYWSQQDWEGLAPLSLLFPASSLVESETVHWAWMSGGDVWAEWGDGPPTAGSCTGGDVGEEKPL